MMWWRLFRHFLVPHPFPRRCCLKCRILGSAVDEALTYLSGEAFRWYILVAYLLMEAAILYYH